MVEVQVDSFLVIVKKMTEPSIASDCLEPIDALDELGVDGAFRDGFMSLSILLDFQYEVSEA